MESLKCKTRIAVLWLIRSASFMLYLILEPVERSASEANQTGNPAVTKESMLAFAVFFFIYWIMAWLSLTLKDKATRWTNLIVGVILAVLLVPAGIRYASAGASLAMLFNAWGCVIALLTVWYSWKLPKQEA
ncbi:MAG: hypothetical protein JXA73_04825 [Acidobacteria bacterium]|nr:hypothetical protein [Acidobacteriota bacterium]